TVTVSVLAATPAVARVRNCRRPTLAGAGAGDVGEPSSVIADPPGRRGVWQVVSQNRGSVKVSAKPVLTRPAAHEVAAGIEPITAATPCSTARRSEVDAPGPAGLPDTIVTRVWSTSWHPNRYRNPRSSCCPPSPQGRCTG